MAAGGGDALLGAGDGVAEPAEAPDTPAAFVGQGVINQQGDGAKELEAGEDEQGDLVGEVFGLPGGALEEVVVAVEVVTPGVVGGFLGPGGFGDAQEGVPAQAHDPTEQELAGSGKGRLGENGREGIDH